MSYESRAYDERTDFGPDPVVVLVVRGTHDVSRLINLLAGSPPVIEQLQLGDRVRAQVRRHSGGRAALELLKQHGGPDFTHESRASDRDPGWDDAVDWLINSHHCADLEIQRAFRALAEGRCTRDEADRGDVPDESVGGESDGG